MATEQDIAHCLHREHDFMGCPVAQEAHPMEVAGRLDLPAEMFDKLRTKAFRPIEHIVINQGHPISGEEFAMGSLRHDVDTGEVTITYVNVHTLQVVYKDQVQR